MEDKKQLGKFYTTANVFNNSPFMFWMKSLNVGNAIFTEPFVGSGNIIDMLKFIGYNNDWDCYDVDHDCFSSRPECTFTVRDTLKNHPKGCKFIFTNPPYLARNSATRSGTPFPDTKYDDVYKEALKVMLENADYVAAIIPESFITQGQFTGRLNSVISLPCRAFEDTECPVCLALFDKDSSNDFKIYIMDEFIGLHSYLKKHMYPSASCGHDIKFNDPLGELGLYAVDGTKGPSIRFVLGSEIPSSKVKSSSRSVTRISISPSAIDLNDLIKMLNEALLNERYHTRDVFMTSFKGFRSDGMYRRRLDYKNARRLINFSINCLKEDV